MAKIAIVSQYYPPDPPSWIPGGLAEALAARGHQVRVLTTYPHYETGRVSHGYRQRFHHYEQDGRVTVRRVPLFASHSSNAIARVLNYVSVALSFRLARSFIRDADAIYVYATPMTVADPARAWARSLGIPFVLHVQDMWPESVTGSGILPASLSRIAHVPLNWWLRRIYRNASMTIAIAPTMRSMLIRRGVPARRSITVMNWSNDADAIHPSERKGLPGSLHLVYAGNLGRMQDVESIVRAAAEVKDLPGLRISIAGSGVAETELRKLARSLGVRNVQFMGRLNVQQVTELYADSDFQFVTLRDLPIFEGTIPSKFQAGIANGLPVISTVRGDLRELVTVNRLGYTADPENPRSIAQAIRLAYSTSSADRTEFRHRVRKYYESAMSKTTAVDAIENALTTAIADSRSKRRRA